MNHAKRVIPMSDSSVSIKPEDIQPTVLPDAFIQSDIVRSATRTGGSAWPRGRV